MGKIKISFLIDFSLCLDFSSVKYEDLRTKMKGIFDVKSEFEISESYSEYWATILNCCFISYNLLDDTNDIENFLLFTDFCIQLERMFSLFQIIRSHRNKIIIRFFTINKLYYTTLDGIIIGIILCIFMFNI